MYGGSLVALDRGLMLERRNIDTAQSARLIGMDLLPRMTSALTQAHNPKISVDGNEFSTLNDSFAHHPRISPPSLGQLILLDHRFQQCARECSR
jgi:hypothetical protein